MLFSMALRVVLTSGLLLEPSSTFSFFTCKNLKEIFEFLEDSSMISINYLNCFHISGFQLKIEQEMTNKLNSLQNSNYFNELNR